MSITALRRPAVLDGRPRKATVMGVQDDGRVEVQTSAAKERFVCEVLHPVAAVPLALEPGNRVLVLPPEHDDDYGCLLGTLGAPPKPRVLHVEAGEELHLVCGAGSVRLRADGRVVVRGLEVASIASGVNRIKGGSVEVN